MFASWGNTYTYTLRIQQSLLLLLLLLMGGGPAQRPAATAELYLLVMRCSVAAPQKLHPRQSRSSTRGCCGSESVVFVRVSAHRLCEPVLGAAVAAHPADAVVQGPPVGRRRARHG